MVRALGQLPLDEVADMAGGGDQHEQAAVEEAAGHALAQGLVDLLGRIAATVTGGEQEGSLVEHRPEQVVAQGTGLGGVAGNDDEMFREANLSRKRLEAVLAVASAEALEPGGGGEALLDFVENDPLGLAGAGAHVEKRDSAAGRQPVVGLRVPKAESAMQQVADRERAKEGLAGADAPADRGLVVAPAEEFLQGAQDGRVDAVAQPQIEGAGDEFGGRGGGLFVDSQRLAPGRIPLTEGLRKRVQLRLPYAERPRVDRVQKFLPGVAHHSSPQADSGPRQPPRQPARKRRAQQPRAERAPAAAEGPSARGIAEAGQRGRDREGDPPSGCAPPGRYISRPPGRGDAHGAPRSR